jgi:hypothetical protein
MPAAACPFGGAANAHPVSMQTAAWSDEEEPEARVGAAVEPARSYVPTLARLAAPEEPAGPDER